MNLYNLFISSNNQYPDWDQTIWAKNKKEASEKFYKLLRGEFTKKHILNNMVIVDKGGD